MLNIMKTYCGEETLADKIPIINYEKNETKLG